MKNAKKFLGILAMVSIVAAMMCLSSCTPAGVECGLIGKWEYSKDSLKITVDIKSDDTVTTSSKVAGVGGSFDYTVKSVSDHTITLEKNNVEVDVEYKNLGCDSVEMKLGEGEWYKYSKVN